MKDYKTMNNITERSISERILSHRQMHVIGTCYLLVMRVWGDIQTRHQRQMKRLNSRWAEDFVVHSPYIYS